MVLSLAALVLAAALQDSTARLAPSPLDAFADSGAARLVAAARARRERAERLVEAYDATVTQRIGVGIRALRRDRMLFHQELAAHISWRRDGQTRVEVSGARQAIPVAVSGLHVPEDLDNQVSFLVLDPAEDYLRLMGGDAEGILYPLADGAEAHYRFASGDTTVITLPDGRSIRLLELRVTPRRAEFRLMAGSLWFDADTYGLVRAVFRPARPFDLELDGDPGDDDVPGVLKPIRAEVRYVTVEYGLYEFRWWLPRFLAVDAEASVGSVMHVPVRFERVYSGYRVRGGSEPPAHPARRPAGSVRRRDRDSTATTVDPDSLARAIAACVQRVQDSIRTANEGRMRVEISVGASRVQRRCRREQRQDDRWPIEVVVPADTQALLASPELGAPILDMGDVISETELRQLGREIGAIPERPWQLRTRPQLGVLGALSLARFNRVEGLSLAGKLTFDLGRLEIDALGRFGVADLEPNAEIGLLRPTTALRLRVAGYRRLAAANPEARPLGAINSFSALFFGRDDGEYYRALGAEVTGTPTARQWYDWRVYAERQRAAAVETDASLPRLFDGSRRFRSNIAAQPADEVGAALRARLAASPSLGTTLGADVSLDGATGTFDFARGALALRATADASRKLSLGVEGGAGTSIGAVPVQSRWYLGAPATLRGYAGGAAAGDAFWRARAELAVGIRGARLALFGDAGWAGSRARFGEGTTLTAAGIGGSFLDGLFRADLSKGLRASGGWRFDFYVDGVL